MTQCDRNGSLEAAAQEFSAEQVAQLASADAMRRVAQLQAQLDALRREHNDMRLRSAGSAPDRATAAELGALKQEVAALRAENETLRKQQAGNAVRPHADPVMQSQLAALRRENAALRAHRLVADRLGSQTTLDNRTGGSSVSTPPGGEGQVGIESRHDAAVAAEDVAQLQRLLEQANQLAQRHEREAQRLASEVRSSAPTRLCGNSIKCAGSGPVQGGTDITQVTSLQEELQGPRETVSHAPTTGMLFSSRRPDGGLALEGLKKQNDRLRAQYSTTLQAHHQDSLRLTGDEGQLLHDERRAKSSSIHTCHLALRDEPL